MNCLLVSATAKEITPFLAHYRKNDIKQDTDILITGIGLTAATYALTKQITIKKPAIVIQAGIAGCFDRNISLGSVVVVKQDVIADLSVLEEKQLKTMFEIGLVKPNQRPFHNGSLINPHKKLISQTKLKAVNAISVNQITTNKQMISLYQNKFHPAIESMEGAALHYVCLMEGIAFLQIRSISNHIGERNKNNWKMKDAIISLNKELMRIINNFSEPELVTGNRQP